MLCRNLFIKVDASKMLTSVKGKVALLTHNCNNKCVIAENGADEAFIAGFLKSLIEEKTQDEQMEYAAFAMISALKTEFNVNEELSEAMIRRMQQNHFVSYKVIEEEKENKEEL